MRKSSFYFKMAIIFWVIMMLGFSDNWLYDVDQPSNSNPIFIVHGLLAFSWFSLLVIQSGLVSSRKVKLHRSLGVYTFVVFLLLIPSSLAIYVEMLVSEGEIDPNGLGLLVLYLFAVLLILMAYKKRRKDLSSHKILMSFGSFLMLRPGIDRVFNKLVDVLPFLASIVLYVLTFFVFYYSYFKHRKKVEWYLVAGFIIWLLGAAYGYLI